MDITPSPATAAKPVHTRTRGTILNHRFIAEVIRPFSGLPRGFVTGPSHLSRFIRIIDANARKRALKGGEDRSNRG